MIHLDDMVRIAVEVPPEKRDQVARLLTREDPSAARLLHSILEGYRKPPIAWPPPSLPWTVGPFELVKSLGDGGHGQVYRARRTHLEGFVAVKFFTAGGRTEAFVERVRQEASLARRITGEHAVTVFDAGQIPDGPWYVEMEAVGDADLAAPGGFQDANSIVDEGLGPRDAARHMEHIARTVAKAHALGIVHGDIKPRNILLTPISKRAKLIDFGVASLAGAEDSEGQERRHVGTPEYMAPEQWRDGRAPNEKTDVYALGATLHHLLGGAPPHSDRREGVDSRPAPLPDSVDERLREIVSRAMAERPEDRHSSACELADELHRFLANHPTIDDRRLPGRRVLLFLRRHPGESMIAAVMLAITTAAIAMTVVANGERDEAKTRLAETIGALAQEMGDLNSANAGLDQAERLSMRVKKALDVLADNGKYLENVRRDVAKQRETMAGYVTELGTTKTSLASTQAMLEIRQREAMEFGQQFHACEASRSEQEGRIKAVTAEKERLDRRREELEGARATVAERLRSTEGELEAERTGRRSAEEEVERLRKALAQARPPPVAPPVAAPSGR